MANLAENEAYPAGVYRIEEQDPVSGGPDGIANLPHKHLADRTGWLRAQLAAAQATIAALMASVEALQAADIALRGRVDTLEAEGGSVIESITRGVSLVPNLQGDQTITVAIPQVDMSKAKCEMLTSAGPYRLSLRLATSTTIEIDTLQGFSGLPVSYEVIEYR